MTGRIHFGLLPFQHASQIREGQLRVLAVAGTERSRDLPEVPTIKELGFGTFDASTAYAVFAPKGVSREIIQQLNGEIAKALHNEDTANRLRAAGVEPKLSPPAEVTALLEAEIEQWTRIIKSANIQIR